MMFPKPSRKPRRRWPSVPAKAEIPESSLQLFCDDYLELRQVRYIRLPDGFWRWLAVRGSEGIKRWFRGLFAGIPDNTCFIPINDKYSLCLHLELKTRIGQLHGKQKEWARQLPVQVVRSTDEIKISIDKFIHDAGKLRDELARTKE